MKGDKRTFKNTPKIQGCNKYITSRLRNASNSEVISLKNSTKFQTSIRSKLYS